MILALGIIGLLELGDRTLQNLSLSKKTTLRRLIHIFWLFPQQANG
ncbi:MAG: hypothetical protein KME31_09120 [Tolypothrix carrinoi HA7290-LM1]|nr:hypothetical protein [Tolypothrix carrinoi HA7290-LM1]